VAHFPPTSFIFFVIAIASFKARSNGGHFWGRVFVGVAHLPIPNEGQFHDQFNEATIVGDITSPSCAVHSTLLRRLAVRFRNVNNGDQVCSTELHNCSLDFGKALA
jgi:hypothetical protein